MHGALIYHHNPLIWPHSTDFLCAPLKWCLLRSRTQTSHFNNDFGATLRWNLILFFCQKILLLNNEIHLARIRLCSVRGTWTDSFIFFAESNFRLQRTTKNSNFITSVIVHYVTLRLIFISLNIAWTGCVLAQSRAMPQGMNVLASQRTRKMLVSLIQYNVRYFIPRSYDAMQCDAMWRDKRWAINFTVRSAEELWEHDTSKKEEEKNLQRARKRATRRRIRWKINWTECNRVANK